jgi:hypothetical protein
VNKHEWSITTIGKTTVSDTSLGPCTNLFVPLIESWHALRPIVPVWGVPRAVLELEEEHWTLYAVWRVADVRNRNINHDFLVVPAM